MEKEVSQQGFSPSSPSLPLPDLAKHQDAFGVKTHAKGHFVTHGEKKFDRLTYTTVGYIVNALLSVVAVHWVERTPSGQRTMNKFLNWSKSKFANASPEKLERVEHLATKTFFLSGGFAVLAPMKWLEDAKLKLIKKWDKQYYGEAAETDPNIVQSHKDIEAAPKQGWGSIFASRVLALVPFYITVGALWDRKSTLSRMTNKELGTIHSQATEKYFADNPAKSNNYFSNLFNGDLRRARSKAMNEFIEAHPVEASKGLYFDRPISYASRKIGKLFANGETKAKLAAMEESHPGMIATKTKADGSHDPVHASTPYYFISEAITSGMVAWGVYVLTRVLGPIMGKKVKSPAEKKKEAERVPEVHTNANSEVEKAVAPLVKKEDRPETTIRAGQLEHQAALTQQSQPLLG